MKRISSPQEPPEPSKRICANQDQDEVDAAFENDSASENYLDSMLTLGLDNEEQDEDSGLVTSNSHPSDRGRNGC